MGSVQVLESRTPLASRMLGLQSYYVALLALLIGGHLTQARTFQNRRVQNAKQIATIAAIRRAHSAAKSVSKSHLKVKSATHTSKHTSLSDSDRVNELVLGLLGNTVKRGTDMLREEMMSCPDIKSSDLSKDLLALKHALLAPSKGSDSDHHAPGLSALLAGVKEYHLDATTSKKKVADVLMAVLPE